MVQPSFAHPRRTQASKSTTPTAALDVFLDNQHQSYFEDLYKSEAVCLCILRLLPPVCRQIILHNLWSYSAVKVIDIKAFCQIDIAAPLESVLDIMRPVLDRKILGQMQSKKGKMEFPWNDTFKKGLRNALTGLGTSNSFGVPAEIEEESSLDVDDLTRYGEDTWESILRYMVSSGLGKGLTTSRPKHSVLLLLHFSGLMVDLTDPTGRKVSLERLTITSKGFQFLLEDRQTQLWQVLMFYLTSKDENRQRSADVLSLFFSLGCMELGQGYSASQSFPTSQSVLEDLESYGFIYRPVSADGVRSDTFYPTHLATSLCSGDIGSSQSAEDKRFLILETNYKVYAYTSNELEIAILNLFVDIRIRYQNLVVGKLDRGPVKAAMEKGISASQIISYLSSHAHPQMHASPPPLLHPTIVDQLHLWDKERNRLKTDEAIMYEFFSKELFEASEAEADKYGGMILSLPEQKRLFVDPALKEAMRDFVVARQTELRSML
ncbi:transcription factor Tfb2-domain-containing protein [Naematelia encephala]|uniref:RNA polymerase II transcription factor B subunit 2 n=1 Tax=Naematelia encephala TaxID=71784 RepID=A0A1Y2AHP9_9TREE|nr:transcription factor Tfb2-domain-containing protein [Naematelia encephala]